MIKMNEFPHLIKLLDDDSEWIRERVVEELNDMGPHLDHAIQQNQNEISEENKIWLKQFSQHRRLALFQEDWKKKEYTDNPGKAIKQAILRLAYLDDGTDAEIIEDRIDELLNEFRSTFNTYGPEDLLSFIFQENGFFPSIAVSFYFQPTHIAHVLEQKAGAPVCLVCLLIILADELGLPIWGVFWKNAIWPAIVTHNQALLFDYNGKPLTSSRPIEQDNCTHITYHPATTKKISVFKASVEDLVKLAVQGNIETYCRKANPEMALLYAKLYEQLNKVKRNGKNFTSS